MTHPWRCRAPHNMDVWNRRLFTNGQKSLRGRNNGRPKKASRTKLKCSFQKMKQLHENGNYQLTDEAERLEMRDNKFTKNISSYSIWTRCSQNRRMPFAVYRTESLTEVIRNSENCFIYDFMEKLYVPNLKLSYLIYWNTVETNIISLNSWISNLKSSTKLFFSAFSYFVF